jgi:hypothetical protein
VDQFADRNLRLSGVEEADELLVAVPLHAAADDGTVQDIQRREQGGAAVPLVHMPHTAAAPLLEQQARLGAVECLDLAPLIDRQHDRMRRRIDVKHLAGVLRIVRQPELAHTVRLQAIAAPNAMHQLTLIPTASLMAALVQCVVSPGGSISVDSRSNLNSL